MMNIRRFVGACLAGLIAAQGATEASAQDAQFTVQTQVVNPDLPAFTATLGGLGNGAEFMRGGGGFEPTVFRNRLTAAADAPNTIIADRQQISNYDSWPEGAFDGADIEVLRIVNGVMQTVRRDRVAQGGYHASGWNMATPSGRMIPAGTTRWNFSWDTFNRMDAPYYYTVRAVDASGNLSQPAAAVSITPPGKPGNVAEKATFQKVKLSGGTASLPAPQNLSVRLAVSRTAMLSWDPVPGAAGYVVYRSDLPPERHRGYSIDLEGTGEPIRKGDMILLRKTFTTPTRAEISTNRVWGAATPTSTFGISFLPGLAGDPGLPDFRLVPHDPDTPVPDPGETYLQVDLKNGGDIQLGKFNFAGPANGYYPTLKPDETYRFEIWLRGQGRITGRFGAGGVYKSIPGLPVEFRVGPEWQKYVVDFRVPPAPPESRSVGKMGIRLFGHGQVDVDNLRIYQLGTDFMDIRPEDRAALMDSGMSALRTHMFIKTKFSSYDLSQLTAPAGVAPRSGGHSLPQMLGITRSLGMDPWVQVEPHFSAEEWLGLVEYLAAPFDPAKDDPKALPWAARRAAQGHSAPWTEDFNKIWFEIGNETWNRLFAPWTFQPMADAGRLNWTKYTAGEVYGLYQEHVLSIMRQSPWWDRLEPKLEPVIGGWGINDYGVDALKRSPGSRVLTNAAYIGGWDSGEGAVQQTPEGYASVMAYAPQVMAAAAKRYHDAVAKAAPDRDVILGTYESGPGYELNGLNGAKVTPEAALAQEKVMKGAGAGAATLDSFLIRAMAGDRIQNFFTYGRGDKFRSHARLDEGGQPYPSWAWLALFNHLGAGGDLLAVETEAVPKRDLPAISRRKEIPDAPMAAVYASRKGDRLTVVVVSRAVPDVPPGTDGHMSVAVDLPIVGAKSLTRYHESGDYRAENFTGPGTEIVSDTLPVPSDPGRLEIPDLAPASAEVYVFEGAEFPG
ncbi:hypothetical protein [Paenirhodobacter populi]|uniref:Uncharacterized protein n=1 Tax=Paenirhodobacter populi TaxID=2306993 RepID=A0A443JC01_9RHOB|nr:hypothetical protein [Sinirhodobacter populi]RWR18000.1 hypothetical protein D2T30_17300 [Sinirhodobacter populi]